MRPIRDLALRKMVRVLDCSQRSRVTLRLRNKRSALGQRLGVNEVGFCLTRVLRLGRGPGLSCCLHVGLWMCWWPWRRRTNRSPRRRMATKLNVRGGGWLDVAVQRSLHGGGGSDLGPNLCMRDHWFREETL